MLEMKWLTLYRLAPSTAVWNNSATRKKNDSTKNIGYSLTFLKFEYHEPTEEPRKPTLKGTSSSKTPSGGVARHHQ